MAKQSKLVECSKEMAKGFDISHQPPRIDYHAEWYLKLLTENEKYNLEKYGQIKTPN